MNIEKRKEFIINFIYIAILLIILFIFFPYLLSIISPFVIGFIIAYILNKPIIYLSKKINNKRGISAIIVVTLFYATIGVLFFLLSIRIFEFTKELFIILPDLYNNQIAPQLTNFFEQIQISISKLDSSLLTTLEELSKNTVASLSNVITDFSGNVVKNISGYITTLPGFFLKSLFMIISTFFFAIDFPTITDFLLRQLKDKHQALIIDIKNYIINTLFKCIKSYALIMTITFIELTIGFLIIKIPNAMIIALLISIFDILPVLGTGGIMIPWILISAIQSDFTLAISLSLIYLIVTIIRNILEPKIIGNQVGLHPLVTLMALFIGTHFFGLVGLISFPIIVSLLMYLNNKGTIHIIK
ncbi:MAG: sporulation integral membrane protein YtvI [Erysipelotrichaceae bacterium]